MPFYLIEFFAIEICWVSKTLDLYMHAFAKYSCAINSF